MTEAEHALDPAGIDAFYQVAGARRDVRNGFLPDPGKSQVYRPAVGLGQVEGWECPGD